jgi:hypothetical protein
VIDSLPRQGRMGRAWQADMPSQDQKNQIFFPLICTYERANRKFCLNLHFACNCKLVCFSNQLFLLILFQTNKKSCNNNRDNVEHWPSAMKPYLLLSCQQFIS